MRVLIHPVSNKPSGVMGTPVGYGFHVGDIVELTTRIGIRQINIIIEKDGEAFPMGWMGTEWEYLTKGLNMKVLHPYNEVTQELINEKSKYKPSIIRGLMAI